MALIRFCTSSTPETASFTAGRAGVAARFRLRGQLGLAGGVLRDHRRRARQLLHGRRDLHHRGRLLRGARGQLGRDLVDRVGRRGHLDRAVLDLLREPRKRSARRLRNLRQPLRQIPRVLDRAHQIARPELLEGQDQLGLQPRPALAPRRELQLQAPEVGEHPQSVGEDPAAADRQEGVARPGRPLLAAEHQQQVPHQGEPRHQDPADQGVFGVASLALCVHPVTSSLRDGHSAPSRPPSKRHGEAPGAFWRIQTKRGRRIGNSPPSRKPRTPPRCSRNRLSYRIGSTNSASL